MPTHWRSSTRRRAAALPARRMPRSTIVRWRMRPQLRRRQTSVSRPSTRMRSKHSLRQSRSASGGGGSAPGVSAGEALSAALHEAIGSLTVEELDALATQVRGDGAGSGEGSAAAADDEADALVRARRTLFDALVADAPAPLLEKASGAGVDLSALGLLDVPAAAAPPGASTGSSTPTPSSSSGESRKQHAFVNPPDAFWGDRSMLDTSQSLMARPIADDVVVNDGLVIRKNWGGARKPSERMSYHGPDFLDTLRRNVEIRNQRVKWRAEGRHFPYPNKGRIIFTDVVRPHRNVQMARRSWVAVKGQGIVEPTESEARAAAIRVQPPVLRSRLKRNTLIRGTAVQW